jgi:hypothetical protein
MRAARPRSPRLLLPLGASCEHCKHLSAVWRRAGATRRADRDPGSARGGLSRLFACVVERGVVSLAVVTDKLVAQRLHTLVRGHAVVENDPVGRRLVVAVRVARDRRERDCAADVLRRSDEVGMTGGGSGGSWLSAKTGVSLKNVRGRWSGSAPFRCHRSSCLREGGHGAQIRIAVPPGLRQ